MVDAKTHREDTKMPNLVSVERLTRFYESDFNVFSLIFIRYQIENTKSGRFRGFVLDGGSDDVWIVRSATSDTGCNCFCGLVFLAGKSRYRDPDRVQPYGKRKTGEAMRDRSACGVCGIV